MNTVRSQDGTTIAFDQVGQGPAVILVGGAFQHRALDSQTAALAALLAERFTVIHYDRRGRGDSGDTAPYAVGREVDDIAALIAAVGGSAAVYGMSSGAVLALEAARQGLPITRLSLYEPPFIVDDGRPPVPATYLGELEGLLSAGRRDDAVAYFMTEAAGVPADVVASMREQPFWPAFAGVAHTLPYDAAVMGDTTSGLPLPTGRWEGIAVPTFILTGGASPAFWHTAGQALTDLLPEARRVVLPDQAHGAAPEVLAPVLAEFFGV